MDLIPKIIDTRRVMTILREDDQEELVEVNPFAPKPVMDSQRNPETGKIRRIFNPKIGKFGVTVTIGPSYATKRIEASESMMDFARALPQTAQFVADLIAKNQDWPGAQEFATRIAKTLPPNLLTPEQKDMTPQIQALLQSMDAQIKQMTMERQQMLKALTDQQQERAIEIDSINKKFELGLMQVMQKADAAFNKDMTSRMDTLVTHISALVENLNKPSPNGQAVPSG